MTRRHHDSVIGSRHNTVSTPSRRLLAQQYVARRVLVGGLALLSLATVGLAPAALAASDSKAVSASSSKASVVHVEAAWVGEVPPNSDVAAMYLTLVNDSAQSVRVRRMTSPLAAAVQWHDMSMDKGMMHMQERTRIVLPAHSRTTLAPGSSHLMLVGLKGPLFIGQSVPVSFDLVGQPTLQLAAKVVRRDPD